MNTIMEFGKRNVKWIVGGVVSAVVAVAAVVAYNRYSDEDEYAEVVLDVEPAEPESVEDEG